MGVTLKKRKLKDGYSYYLDIHHGGERSYEFLHSVNNSDKTKTEKKNIASEIKAQRELDLASEDSTYVPKHKKNQNLLLFFEAYIQAYDKKDLRTIQAALKKFIQYTDNDKLKISDLKEKNIEGFKDYLLNGSGLKGDTPYTYWKRFKKVLKHTAKERFISDAIYKNIAWKKEQNSEDTLKKAILTEGELNILFNSHCGNPEVKRAFLFACYSGLGYAEFKVLKWSNIVNGRLIINRAKTGNEINIQLADRAVQLLGEKAEGLIFNLKNESGKFLSEAAINKGIKNWVKRAEVDKHLTFYCGRHTLAVRLLNGGCNLKTVSDALAHSSTAHTIKYLNYVDALKDQATSTLV